MPMLVWLLCGLTTTAIPPCANDRVAHPNIAALHNKDRMRLFAFMVLFPLEGESQLHLQPVQVWLPFANGVVQLRLECDRIRQIVACPERGTMTQQHIVVINAVGIRVHILVTCIGSYPPESLRKLRIESRHVVSRAALLVRISHQEAFVQELDSMPVV